MDLSPKQLSQNAKKPPPLAEAIDWVSIPVLRASVSVIPGPNIKFEWRIENDQKKDAWAYVVQADLVTEKAQFVRNQLEKLLIAELSKQRANDEVKKSSPLKVITTC